MPLIKQPDAITCLPACIWSVLRFQGYEVELEEVIALCELGPMGAFQPTTLYSLMSSEWDVDVLNRWDTERVRDALIDDRPLIMTLPLEVIGGHTFAHAVVVCEVTSDSVEVMDPLQGEYRTLSLAHIESVAGEGLVGAFFVAGQSPASFQG